MVRAILIKRKDSHPKFVLDAKCSDAKNTLRGYEKVYYYIMRLSGESWAGLSGCSENRLRELKKNGLGFLWWVRGWVPAGREGADGLNLMSMPKREHLGFLTA